MSNILTIRQIRNYLLDQPQEALFDIESCEECPTARCVRSLTGKKAVSNTSQVVVARDGAQPEKIWDIDPAYALFVRAFSCSGIADSCFSTIELVEVLDEIELSNNSDIRKAAHEWYLTKKAQRRPESVGETARATVPSILEPPGSSVDKATSLTLSSLAAGSQEPFDMRVVPDHENPYGRRTRTSKFVVG